MDAGHCCVCGEAIGGLDVYALRAQGKICSRCLLERCIPVGGSMSREAIWNGERRGVRPRGRKAT